MQRLYVIGNGFDLHHGLPTQYDSFKEYLKSHNRVSYDNFVNKFLYETEKNFWNNFEENLSNLHSEKVIDGLINHLPRFRSEFKGAFGIEVNNFVKTITYDLKASFIEFIKDAVAKGEQEKKLNIIVQDSRFISFNYTPTLERLYSVKEKDILYIHGNVYKKSEDIVLGHGVDPSEIEFGNYMPDMNDSGVFVEDGWLSCESDLTMMAYNDGANTLRDYYVYSFKNTEKILNENEEFFNSLHDIEEVYVLGHSLSGVDSPYFIRLVKGLPSSVKWYVSYYLEKDKLGNFHKVIDFGVNEDNIEMISISDLE
ncbi:bacteriophage abortive infection AbiH family protein [Vibrio vulnificus]